jgi:hypothetical protein
MVKPRKIPANDLVGMSVMRPAQGSRKENISSHLDSLSELRVLLAAVEDLD